MFQLDTWSNRRSIYSGSTWENPAGSYRRCEDYGVRNGSSDVAGIVPCRDNKAKDKGSHDCHDAGPAVAAA